MLKLYEEKLANGRIRYYSCDSRRLFMQIPEEIRKCVGFVAKRQKRGPLKWEGTAFFLVFPQAQPAAEFGYVVTARHIIEACGKHPILVFNMASGGKKYLPTDNDEWFPASDSTVDMTMRPFDYDERVDLAFISSEQCVTDEFMRQENIGAGRNVFFTGLFNEVPGESKNIPIVRTGTIAAIPDERVKSRRFGTADLYLLDTRSISGHSGSPVFVVDEPVKFIEGHPLPRFSSKFSLLGLISGHYEAEFPKGDKENFGISFIVPAKYILAMLNQKELVDERGEELAEQEKTRHGNDVLD
jgi:hypothetical protein